MPQVFEILSSAYFMRVMFNVAFAIFALGLVVAVITLILRAKGQAGEQAQRDPMVLLIASTRDAIIITALYLADSLFYLSNEIFSYAAQQYPALIVWMPLANLILRGVMFATASWIALHRIYILGVWLKARE